MRRDRNWRYKIMDAIAWAVLSIAWVLLFVLLAAYLKG